MIPYEELCAALERFAAARRGEPTATTSSPPSQGGEAAGGGGSSGVASESTMVSRSAEPSTEIDLGDVLSEE
jgi:hypothetical protein